MELHETCFFCSRKEIPTCYMSIDKMDGIWPVTIRFDKLVIYLSSIQDLVNFKNSFLSSYEKAMRGDEDA